MCVDSLRCVTERSDALILPTVGTQHNAPTQYDLSAAIDDLIQSSLHFLRSLLILRSSVGPAAGICSVDISKCFFPRARISFTFISATMFRQINQTVLLFAICAIVNCFPDGGPADTCIPIFVACYQCFKFVGVIEMNCNVIKWINPYIEFDRC